MKHGDPTADFLWCIRRLREVEGGYLQDVRDRLKR